MKKITVLILILLCFVMPVNVFPESSTIDDVYIYYGDEDSMGRGRGDWSVPVQSEGTYMEKAVIDGECAFHIYGGEENDSITAKLYLSQFSRNRSKKFIVQFKMRVDNIKSLINSTADEGPNPNWHFFDYFSIDSGGGMTIGGKSIATIQSGVFYELAFLTDNISKSCKVYVGGDYVGSFSFDENYNYLAEYGFTLSGKNGGSHMYIADFSIYESEALASFSEIEKAYNVKKELVSMCPMNEEVSSCIGQYAVFAADAPYMHFGGERKNINVRFINSGDTLMAPIKTVGNLFDAIVSETESSISITYKGKRLTFSKNGEETVMKDGVLYANAEEYVALFGNVYYDKQYSVIVVGGGDFTDELSERVDIREICYYLMYQRPEQTQLLADYKTASENMHPRIYYNAEKIEKIKSLVSTDEDMKIWYDGQIEAAETVFRLPVIRLIKSEQELNTSFSGDLTTFSKLAFAYMMTKDKKWGDDLWRAIDGFMSANEDLNHRRAFLNGSEMARQMALSYDWAYDYFTEEQRAEIEEYLYLTTFEPWMRAHQGMVGFPSSGYAYKSKSNINCVLAAQIGVAAMAVFEENPAFYAKLMTAIFRQLEYFLPNYAPDGGYFEGPSYWEYATTNLVDLFEATEGTFGTLYGMYDVYNVKDTGTFPLYMNGDKLQFTMGDGYRLSLIGDLPTSYYFALKNGDKEFATVIVNAMREAGYEVGSRRYDPAFQAESINELGKDKYFRVVEAGSMRENWTSEGAYLAYHGGDNSIGHGDLDIGTFVFDAFGKRWAEELGSDDYNYDQYFGTKRYLYYKKRGEGQNVLLINPYGKYEDQKKDAYSTLESSATGEKGAYAVLDTSEAYGDSVLSAKRGFMLTDNRTQAVVRDEVSLVGEDNELYWFMHTMADAEIEGDGKTAVLTIGRHKCILTLSSSENAHFEIMKPEHLAENTKPQSQYYTNLSDTYKKIAVHLTDVEGDAYINVSMKVIDVTKEAVMPAEINVPISKWNEVFNSEFENKPYKNGVFFSNDEEAILYPVNNSKILLDKTYISLAGAGVVSADIYVDNNLLENFTKPPFGKSVSLPDGVHTIRAEYTDYKGDTHVVYSNITVMSEYGVKKERVFSFEAFDNYEEVTDEYKVINDSLFLSGYGSKSTYSYTDIASTDIGYGKSLLSETITGDVYGMGLTDWGDTWDEALYVEYDYLCTDFSQRKGELFAPTVNGGRRSPYTVLNGKLLEGDNEVFSFENGKWYKISMLFDSVKSEMSMYINGECIAENKYVEGLNDTMRPGCLLLGSYNPESVIMLDNYTAVNLVKIPKFSIDCGSETSGYIPKGTDRIKITFENKIQKSSINKNTLQIEKNGEKISYSLEYGAEELVFSDKYVREITLILPEGATYGDEYTLYLKKGINALRNNFSYKNHATFSEDKGIELVSDKALRVNNFIAEKNGSEVTYSYESISVGEENKITFIVAFYDDEKKMTDIRIVREEIAEGINDVKKTVALNEDGKYFRVFLRKNNDLLTP